MGNWFGQTWFNPALPLSSCVTLNLTVGTRAGHVAGSEAGGDLRAAFVPCPGPRPTTRLGFTGQPLWAHAPPSEPLWPWVSVQGRRHPPLPVHFPMTPASFCTPPPREQRLQGNVNTGLGYT